MRTGLNFQPQDAFYPFRGIDSRAPATMIASGASPESFNIYFRDDYIVRRKGYETILGVGESAMDGIVMALIEFETSAGDKKLIALTTTKQYVFDFSNSRWTDVTYQTGDPLADVDMTGTEDNPYDWTVGTGEDGKWIVITNGIDKPRYWDGGVSLTKFAILDLSSVFTGFSSCKTVDVFYNHLVVGGIDATADLSQYIAWSDTNDLDDFTNGNAGTNFMSNAQGDVVMLKMLANRLVVYSENSIDLITFVGGSVYFSFEHVVDHTRLIAGKGVINLGPYHIFGSQENFYLFDGTQTLRPIGDQIARSFRNEVNLEYALRFQGFNDEVKHRVYWITPTDAATSVVWILEYGLFDPQAFRWTRISPSNRATAYGFFQREEDLTYDDSRLVGVGYDELDIPYNEADIRQGTPVRVLGSASGDVYRDEEVDFDDDGTDFESWWDTKDFFVGDAYTSELARWLELEFEATGDELDVYYSSDRGVTWTLLSSGVSLSSSVTQYKLFLDVTSRTMRFRFYSASSKSYRIQSLRAWYRPGRMPR